MKFESMEVLLMPLPCPSVILNQIFIRHPYPIVVNPVLAVIPRNFVRKAVSPIYDLHMANIKIPPWMFVVPAVVEFPGVKMRMNSATMFFVNKLFLIVKFKIVSLVLETARTHLDASPTASLFVMVVGL